jgi:CheY-like chemotaxis protein
MHPDTLSGQYVMISLEDTGISMAPEVVNRIFEPFYTPKEVGKGTALGLSTVHTIVKSHAGFINVYSEVGKGTIFRVYLPAGKLNNAHPSAVAAENIYSGKGELILVVDDEVSTCEVMQDTLETFGYRAITATDGAEALALYASRQNEIAAVITDMMMPVMDGSSTIRVLRRLNPKVKIIATSGLVGNGHESSIGEYAADAFVSAPFTAQKVRKTLRKVLTDQTWGLQHCWRIIQSN